MKNILLIFFLFFCYNVVAQQRFPTGAPTQFSTGWFKQGYQQSDSGTIIANRDTSWKAKYSGTIVFKPSDKKFYYFDSTVLAWFPLIASALDTTSLSNRINLKLNISDTIGRWLAQSTRLVDSIYRINDSTIGYTIKGTPYTFQILGSAAGGGGTGTVTSVGLSMPSAFTVSTPNPITTSGIFSVLGAGTTSQYIRGNGTLGTTDTGMIPNFYLKVRGLISGTSPIVFNQTTGAIGIPNANTSGAKGAATFNSAYFTDNGSGLISLTNPVSAGSCTNCDFTVGADGRIIAYSNGATPGITTLNGLTASSQNFAVGTGGTDFNISSSGSTHTFNFPSASAFNRGLLTAADWTVFNNKLSNITGLIQAGTNVTISGNGIAGDPYIINSNGGGGGGTNNANIGTGFRWLNGVTQELRTAANSPTITWDSISTANTLTAKVDTSVIATLYDLSQLVIANNGVTRNVDSVQLGQELGASGNPAALTHNTEIPLNGFNTSFTGTGGLGIGTSTVGNRKLNISATSTTQGVNITTVDGTGINVVASGTANALFAQAGGTGIGVTGSSSGSSGYGVLANSSNNNAIPFKANNFSTLTNSATPVVAELVRNVFGTPADGVGLSIMFRGQTTNTTDVETGQIRNYLSTALHANRSSAFEFHLVNNTVSARKALLASTGQWTWDGYPALPAQVDTTTYKPVAIDGSGNVVKMAGWAGSGGGGSGVTTVQPIGSTPNANGATISGVNLTLQPATANIGGVLTKDTQSIGGDKYFISKRTTFYGPNGKSPIVNALYSPSAVTSDSFYISGKYIGFGFIDQFTSGTIVQCLFQADDHVGTNAHIRMRRSYDQGRSWVTNTIDTGAAGYYVTGLSGGVTHSNRLVVFLQRINTSGGFIDQRIMYSDDEGATFSPQQIISSNSETIFQPYGPLCKIGGDSLLLSWYGQTGTTYSSYIIKSGDDGVTWSSPISIVTSTTQQSTETSVMYLGGSTLIALARREQSDSAYGQYISVDNGTTWSYQGKTNFGQSGTPAWTKTFKGKNGKLICVAYYKSGAYQSPIKATYGYADSIAMGPQYWDLNTTTNIVSSMRGNGYIQVAHPGYSMYSIGTYYDETVIIDDATTKYLNVPLGSDLPIGEKWVTVNNGINYKWPGFVGVNNAAPEAKFHVNGLVDKTGAEETVQILSSNDASNQLVMDFNIGNNATAESRFASIQVTERGVARRSLLLNPNGGNVGIGMATPALSPFHVKAATAATSVYSMRVIDNNSSIGTNIAIGNTSVAVYKSIFVDANGLNLGNTDVSMNAAATPVLTIDNSTAGRVGIDVAVPTARVHIEGGSSFGGTAPLKINSGTLMTTPENGAFENDGSTIYATVGGVRYPITGGTWTAVTGGINYSTGDVGINNATPTVKLDVKGDNAKTGSVETVAVFGSSDASQALNLFMDIGNNATAGSRYVSFQGVESGVSFRPLVLQPSGANVLVGTTTDGGEKFQVTGSVALDLGSDATGDIFYRNSGGSFTRLGIGSTGDVLTVAGGLPSWAASGGSATTIYNGDGSISSNRTVTLGNNNLTFNASSTGELEFTLGSDATGDIYYRNSSGFITRLGAGTNGDILTVSGGLPSWQTTTLTTLYSGDGTLAGNRNLSGDSKQLNFGIPASKLSGFGIATSGQIFLQGQVQFSSAASVDADYAVSIETPWVVLADITANRNVSLSSPGIGAGKMLIIWNKNSSGNTWTFTGQPVVDASGASITTLANDTVYYLINDGVSWVKIN
jgi:hypothetical protein